MGIHTGASGETELVLDDGRRLLIRDIRPEDTDALIAMHRRLSGVSAARRFFIPLPELARPQAERFTHVDGTDRAALVAQIDNGDLVAVVRYERLAGTPDAEVAIVVQDDYQHHTIGTTLLTLLTRRARDSGISRFIADVLTENTPMFRTFRDAQLVGSTEYERSVAHLILPLPRDR